MQTEWVHQVDLGSKKAAIIFACIDLPMNIHIGRHFSANGFVAVSDANRHEICTRSR